MGKRDAEHQLDSYNWQADDNDDGPQDFQRASEREISRRQIKPLRKGIRKSAATNARSNPYANSFKPSEPVNSSNTTGLFGIPAANASAATTNLFSQATPALAPKVDNSNEIRLFAEKIVGLNKSFLKQVTDYVNQTSNIDLCVLCNEYIKFRKEIIASQPSESSTKAPIFGAALTSDSNLTALEKEKQGKFSDGASKPPLFTSSFNSTGKNEESPAKPSFSFGGPPASDKPLFTIGSKSENKDSSFEAPKLSFGAPNTNQFSKPESTVESKPAFAFGAPKTDSAIPPAFSFGAPKTDSKTTAAGKPAFIFGAPKTVTLDEKPSNASSGPQGDSSDKSLFTFGAKENTKAAEEPLFSIGAKTDTATENPKFTFGAKTDSDPKEKPAFSFGAPKTDSTTTAPAFSFSTPKSDIATPTPAPKGDAPTSTFSFGAAKDSSNAASGFSFAAPKTDAVSKPAFSFGASADTGKAPFTFGAPKADAPAFSFATPKVDDKPVSLVANMGDPKPLNSTFQFSKPEEPAAEEDAMPELAQVGETLMHGEGEENETSIHEQKSKIFVQTTNEDGKKDWNAIGVGILKVKDTRLLCRAENSGRVLLNARLYKAMKLTKVGDKQFTTILMHEEQMKPVLIRCGKVDETDKLIQVIQETAKSN
ncbi:hypothetical protein HDV06_003790 [Boothiomyces sp. JEL0866]|nr:hypothetical protein HDV06_003790 [Boothiomyces sp. JEL0866]